MKNLKDYISIVESETPVSEQARKKVADKVFQNIVGQSAAQRMAAELPSKAVINGQTWEKVGNNFFNRQSNKVISQDEFVQMRTAAGQAPKPGTAAPGAAPAAAPAAAATTTGQRVAGNLKQSLAKKGTALKRFAQRNPKLAVALGLIGGVAAYKVGSDIVNPQPAEEPPVAPNQAGPGQTPPAQTPPEQSGKPQEPSESDKLKAEIDALFKELDPVKDQPVPDELKRLRGKYEGSATASNTVQQSGKPASAKPSDPFADTYSKFDLQSRIAADSKK